MPGELAQVLPSPRHFEQAAELVTPDQTAQAVVCGPAVERHVQQLRTCLDWSSRRRAYGDEVLPGVRGG